MQTASYHKPVEYRKLFKERSGLRFKMPVDDHVLDKPAAKRAARATPVVHTVPVTHGFPVVPLVPIAPVVPPAPAPRKRIPRAEPAPAKAAARPRAPRRAEDSTMRELKSEVRNLTESINELMRVFRKAHEDIKEEPHVDLSPKLDRIVEQNHEIGRVLLLLLELHKEHLPKIAKHTRISSELKLRWPPAKIFSEHIR